MEKRMKKKSSMVALISFVLCINVAFGEDQYQAQISTIYQWIDSRDSRATFISLMPEEPTDNRTISYGFSGEIFFAPVSTVDHPYAEAAFLEHIGSAFFSWQHMDFRSGIRHGTGPEQQFVLNYARPGFPLAIAISFDKSRLRFYDSGQGETREYKSGISIGNYLTNSLLVGIEIAYNYAEAINMINVNPDMFFLNSETLGYGVVSKYVRQLNRDRSVSFQSRINQTRSVHSAQPINTTESVSLVYYWTRRMSAGIGFENSSSKSLAIPGGRTYSAIPGGRTYSANFEYFFTRRLSLTGAYGRFHLTDNNLGFGDANSFNFTLAARF